MTRAGLPYLMVSLGLHLALLLVLLFLKGPQLPEIRQRRVVIELSPRREVPERSEVRPEQRTAEILAPVAEPLSGSLDLSGPRSLAVPSGRVPAERTSSRSESLPAARAALALPEAGEAAEVPRAAIRMSVPTVDEILADLPAPTPAAMGDGPSAAGERPAHGYLDPGALEWRGRERKVIKATRPEFPEVLLQEGQEVDVEATFKVAPNGQVVRVEITRSSGYSTVDRAVERALANYLFETSTTDDEDTGRIRFRFRLERLN